MVGINRYEEKQRREIRRKLHKEKDFRFPKRKKNRLEGDYDETDDA